MYHLGVAFDLDRVFRSDCSTRQVYEDGAKAVVLSVVSGINCEHTHLITSSSSFLVNLDVAHV